MWIGGANRLGRRYVVVDRGFGKGMLRRGGAGGIQGGICEGSGRDVVDLIFAVVRGMLWGRGHLRGLGLRLLRVLER